MAEIIQDVAIDTASVRAGGLVRDFRELKVTRLRAGRPVLLSGDGFGLWHPVYIGDIAKGASKVSDLAGYPSYDGARRL